MNKEQDIRALLELWSFMKVGGNSSLLQSFAKELKSARQESFFCRIIDKKFEVFGIDIKLDTCLLLIIETAVDGNPGQSQLILSEVMEHIAPISPGYEIMPDDFIRTYFKGHSGHFPIVSEYPDTYRNLEKRWNEQKVKMNNPLASDNAVDYPEYWHRFFK